MVATDLVWCTEAQDGFEGSSDKTLPEVGPEQWPAHGVQGFTLLLKGSGCPVYSRMVEGVVAIPAGF